jgi:hypothetical protein
VKKIPENLPQSALLARTNGAIEPKRELPKDRQPTLAERNAVEGPLRRPTSKRKNAPSPGKEQSRPPRFIRQEGSVLEPIGELGKPSPVTRVDRRQAGIDEAARRAIREADKRPASAPSETDIADTPRVSFADRLREEGVRAQLGKGDKVSLKAKARRP